VDTDEVAAQLLRVGGRDGLDELGGRRHRRLQRQPQEVQPHLPRLAADPVDRAAKGRGALGEARGEPARPLRPALCGERGQPDEQLDGGIRAHLDGEGGSGGRRVVDSLTYHRRIHSIIIGR
jgi:hypothetical protein